MYLANLFGPQGRIVLWGGDVEMGRLTLERTTIQTGVPLEKRLSTGYRTAAFAIGGGIIRARVPSVNRSSSGRGSGEPGFSDARVARPTQDSYEDVLNRVPTPSGGRGVLAGRAKPSGRQGRRLAARPAPNAPHH